MSERTKLPETIIGEQKEIIHLDGQISAVNKARNEIENSRGETLSNFDTVYSMRSELARRERNLVGAEGELQSSLAGAWKEFTADDIMDGEVSYLNYLKLLKRCGIDNLRFVCGKRELPKRIDETEVKKGLKYFEEFSEAAEQCVKEGERAYHNCFSNTEKRTLISEIYKGYYEAQERLSKIAEQAAPYWWVLINQQK